MKIVLNKKTAAKLKLEYGSLNNYAQRFTKLGFDSVDIMVWDTK